MKQTFLTLLLASSMLCAEAKTGMIDILDLDPAAVEEFAKGDYQDVIVRCPEGIFLPFHMNIKGEFLDLDPTPLVYIKVVKTCYIKCLGPQVLLFSSDLKVWKNFDEFFTGSINLSYKIEDKEPAIGLNALLNQRP